MATIRSGSSSSYLNDFILNASLQIILFDLRLIKIIPFRLKTFTCFFFKHFISRSNFYVKFFFFLQLFFLSFKNLIEFFFCCRFLWIANFISTRKSCGKSIKIYIMLFNSVRKRYLAKKRSH